MTNICTRRSLQGAGWGGLALRTLSFPDQAKTSQYSLDV